MPTSERQVFHPDKYPLVILRYIFLMIFFFLVVDLFKSRQHDNLFPTVWVFLPFSFLLSFYHSHKLQVDNLGVTGPENSNINFFVWNYRTFIGWHEMELSSSEEKNDNGLLIRNKKSSKKIITSKRYFKPETINKIKNLLETRLSQAS